MSKTKFFDKLFNYKKKHITEIVRYETNIKSEIQDKINQQIKEIDNKIIETSKSLLEAQVVKLRSKLSKSNNFIEKVGKNIYKQKIEDSIDWHQKQLKDLYTKRKVLQINLEKTKGIYWLSQIKRFLKIILIGFFLLLLLFIFLSGFMIIIYLIPLIIFILLIYFLFTKKY